MTEKLEDRCKRLIVQHEYKECEKKLGEAMLQNPHSAISHNLMGILMEKERNHVLAMKHFRAAYALDPTYIPACYNMEQYRKVTLMVWKNPDCQGLFSFTFTGYLWWSTHTCISVCEYCTNSR